MAILEKLSIHKEETSSKVYFTFFGEFYKDEITSIMQIPPTYSFNKGEKMRNKLTDDDNPPKYKFSRWSYGTDYENTRDIEEQCDRIIAQLKNKIPEILSIIEHYNCKTEFVIVSVVEKGKTPALHFNQNILDFCIAVKADIDIDIYANAYDESENIIEIDI